MSWFSTHYEKALLGAALAIALAFGYLGWSKLDGMDQEFGIELIGKGNNNTAVTNADAIPKALQSMRLDRTWTTARDGERPVDLFVGIPLFIKDSDPEKALDLLTDSPVHPPIPNSWWLENHIYPGYANSPDRDPDGDGFSNIEEWNEKTDPNNEKAHPPLINKLVYVKDESLIWAIRPGYGTDGAFSFSYSDNMGKRGRRNKLPPGELIRPDGLFFPTPPMRDRFKLLGSEVRKEMNRAINLEVDVTYVRIEDQKPNKKGTIYEIPSPLGEDRLNDFAQFDRTAVLSLYALGMTGKDFKVEENTTFALPPGAENQEYLLKQVTPTSIIVEYPDAQGNRKTVEIIKGGMPSATR
jgi:hypothetical protein